MIKSMTAFARADTKEETLTVLIEIRAYNSRHLDLVLRIPQPYIMLENKVKTVISEWVTRGRIEVSLQIRDTANDAYVFEANLPRAKAYHRALEQLKSSFKIAGDIPLDLLAGAGDIIIAGDVDKHPDTFWPAIEKCLIRALKDLDAMRRQEGQYLADDLTRRMNYVKQGILNIEQESSDLVSHYQERLKTRIEALTRGLVELDPDRIALEAALLADKVDISEEIVRACSHIEQFHGIVDSDKPAGRKLNFLLQELNREINTIGAKTGKALVSHLVVDVKTELEKIREQVQNIE
jgi:uncharacterized protein (TIGR00255 family)